MNRLLSLLTIALAAFVAVPVMAEKVPMSPAEMLKTATHVVKGQVNSIYERVVRDVNWETTYYVAEVRVDECEKGDGLKKGDLMYVRYWQRGWIGKGNPPPSTAGHRGLPVQGETLRIYTSRNAYDGFSTGNNDSGFNVLGTNGFEKLPAVPGK